MSGGFAGWSHGVEDAWSEGELSLVSATNDGLLAMRIGGRDQAILASRDGLTWTNVAPVPDTYEWGGSEGLIAPNASPMLFADDGAPGGGSFGNRLGGWLLGSGGTWTRVLDRQPAFSIWQAGDGDAVIVVGQGWDVADQRWPWTLVSLDGGRTWDPDLSWIGAAGSCVGAVAIGDNLAVMLGCDRTEPAIWAAPLPTAAEPDAGGSPSPMATSPSSASPVPRPSPVA